MATALRSAIDDARASAIPSSEANPAAAVVRSLGRIEARKMVLHPVFPLTIAFGLLLSRGLIGSGGEDFVSVWLLGAATVGILIGVVLTTNVAALRARRDGVDELYGSLPAPPEARTAGLLAGLLIGPGALAVLVAALGWAVLSRIPRFADDVDPLLAAQFVLAVIALGTIGIAVGRWIPTLLGGPIVVALHVFTGLIWAVPWIATTEEIDLGWHLVYLVAAPLTWSALAFARDRRTITRFAVAGAAFALGVVAAFLQVPPGGY